MTTSLEDLILSLSKDEGVRVNPPTPHGHRPRRGHITRLMDTRPFIKMHGLGNDFVIVDARAEPFAPAATARRRIADRRFGVGCDQLVILEPARYGADLSLRFYNPDGGEAQACGNGTRCAASLVMAETGAESLNIRTLGGLLHAEAAGSGTISVDMGEAKTAWRDIPLTREMETLHLELAAGPLHDPVATGMGNPHATFFVDDLSAIDLGVLGPKLEHDALFPERANIGVAQVTGPDRLRLRVWERGTGLTLACGSGACAATVAAARRGLTGRNVTLDLDGGTLHVAWREDGHAVMTGPVATAYTGELDPSLLEPGP
jgi:diaminopimelate epimerase